MPQAAAAEVPKVGPVNNIMHSLFNQVDVFLNQKPVLPPTNAYAYKAYLETLLNYGPSAKNSNLMSVLWYNDSAGKMDEGTDANTGLVQRRKLLLATKSVDMIDYLHCDILNQEKLLINGIEVKVRLVRSRDSFYLMDPMGCYFAHIDEPNLLDA